MLPRQRTVAKQLGMTIRNMQRLMQQWRSLGVGGIVRHERKDRGGHRVNNEWYDFIVKTYRQGNRGSGRMSRAQVAVRVAAILTLKIPYRLLRKLLISCLENPVVCFQLVPVFCGLDRFSINMRIAGCAAGTPPLNGYV